MCLAILQLNFTLFSACDRMKRRKRSSSTRGSKAENLACLSK